MDLLLEGRTAVVTGASSGIGEGVARVLAAEGAHLVIAGRDAAELERVRRELGSHVVAVAADLTLPEGVERLAAAGRGASILVNCAGGSRPVSLDSDDESWDEAFALNFTAARRLAAALVPAMREARWGRIVNISGSMEPRALNAASAAKAALHLWAKGLSCDLAPDGITVNSIMPGRINSRQILTRLHPDEEKRREFIARNIPAGYFGEPEDVGRLVAYLASPLARYVTGAVIPVDGGMRHWAM